MGIERLSQYQGFGDLLAERHIVGDGISADDRGGIGWAYVTALPPDDHGQFDLIVEIIRAAGQPDIVLPGRRRSRGALGTRLRAVGIGMPMPRAAAVKE